MNDLIGLNGIARATFGLMGALIRGSSGPTTNFIYKLLHPEEQFGETRKVMPGRMAREMVRFLPLGRDPNEGKGKYKIGGEIGSRGLGILKFAIFAEVYSAIFDRAKIGIAEEIATGTCVPHKLRPKFERATLAYGTTTGPDIFAAILVVGKVEADICVRGRVKDRGTY